MSYRLNSLKGVIEGIVCGTTRGVIQGDTRSLDMFRLYGDLPEFEGPCLEPL